MKGIINNFFEIERNNTTIRREILGGITTFSTMSYIIFVQPAILSITGMDFNSVLMATCISSGIACILMAVLANYPFALAPGMGENFLFTFTICLTMGFSWQSALAIVFLSGVLFVFLSLFQVREKIVDILPDCLKHAIPTAIGLLITFVGLQWAGLVIMNPGTMVSIGNPTNEIPLVVILGIIIILFLQKIRFPGAILVSILFSAIAYVLLGIIPLAKPEYTFSFSTFFKLDFTQLSHRWQDAIPAILIFFFLDLFDTVGTLVGVGNVAGFMKEGKLPRARGAFIADALSTCIGSLCGTSTVTSYVESAAGVTAGAKTGFASVVTALCFFVTIPLVPFLGVLGYNVGPAYYAQLGFSDAKISMYPIVAPALIFIGFIMMGSVRKIEWDNITEGFPAFVTIIFMAFGYGITEGISMGCITYVVVKMISGQYREVNTWMYIISGAFLLRYVLLK